MAKPRLYHGRRKLSVKYRQTDGQTDWPNQRDAYVSKNCTGTGNAKKPELFITSQNVLKYLPVFDIPADLLYLG